MVEGVEGDTGERSKGPDQTREGFSIDQVVRLVGVAPNPGLGSAKLERCHRGSGDEVFQTQVVRSILLGVYKLLGRDDRAPALSG